MNESNVIIHPAQYKLANIHRLQAVLGKTPIINSQGLVWIPIKPKTRAQA